MENCNNFLFFVELELIFLRDFAFKYQNSHWIHTYMQVFAYIMYSIIGMIYVVHMYIIKIFFIKALVRSFIGKEIS